MMFAQKEYWKKAIKYIEDHVENPLFFICSDNVDYVIKHLIDTQKYDYICQYSNYPTYISLSVMSECKHFIIGIQLLVGGHNIYQIIKKDCNSTISMDESRYAD